MKRNAWLLLAVVPVGLVAYMLRTSPTPAPASGAEVSDTQMPRLLAEAISARTSKASTASDANVPGSVGEASSPPSPPARPPGAVGPATQTAAQDPAPAEEDEMLAIDAYAAAEHQKIDAWYNTELVGLKTLLEKRMKRANSKEMPAWTKFRELISKWWFTPPNDLRYAWWHSPEEPQRRGVSRPGAYVREDPAKAYARMLHRLKYAWDTQPATFETAQKRLAFLRKEKLARLQDEVAGRKAAVAEKKVRAQAELTRKLAGDPTPIVESIAAAADNQFCAWIDGALVRQGSVVQGYRVRQINTDSVEFEKDGKVWVQKVN